MKLNVILIFDVIITMLGIIIIISGFNSVKRGNITSFFLPAEDLKKVSDKAALCKYLFPIIEAFGCICLAFGVEGLINDAFLPLPWIIDVVFDFVFIGSWFWFSMMLKKARDKYTNQ